MSIFRPDPETLYTALLIDGWWVMDNFGPLYGPYASVRTANEVIIAEKEDAEYGDTPLPGQ